MNAKHCAWQHRRLRETQTRSIENRLVPPIMRPNACPPKFRKVLMSKWLCRFSWFGARTIMGGTNHCFAVQETLLQVAATPRHTGSADRRPARGGLLMVLHTWEAKPWNCVPHVHRDRAGGGLLSRRPAALALLQARLRFPAGASRSQSAVARQVLAFLQGGIRSAVNSLDGGLAHLAGKPAAVRAFLASPLYQKSRCGPCTSTTAPAGRNEALKYH